jgi:hypothetical protein
MFADGAIQQTLSDDGNFEEFESKHAGGATAGPSGAGTTEAGILKSDKDALMRRYGVKPQ